MADFAADPSQIGASAGAIKKVASRIDGAASSVYSTSQGIGGIKSLKNKGYVTKVNNVRSSLRKIADETGTMSSRLSQIADKYSRCETTVRRNFSDTVYHSGVFSESSKATLIHNETARDTTGDPVAPPKPPYEPEEIWDYIKRTIGAEVKDASELTELFHWWRATTGKEIVESIYGWAEGIPQLKNVIKMIVDDANKTVKDYEAVLYTVLNITNPNTWAQGGQAFLNQLGFGWVTGVADRLKRQTDYYVETGAKQIREGHFFQGVTTAIGGSLLAFGDMAVNTCFKTARTVVKRVPGVKTVTKWVNRVTEAATGKSAKKWVDTGLGSVGTWLRSGFERAFIG